MSAVQRLSLSHPSTTNISSISGNGNLETELTKSLDFVINIKDNIHTILDNVGKSYKRLQESFVDNKNDEKNDEILYFESSQQLCNKEMDVKYLQEKAIELNTKLSQLESVLNLMQPIQINYNNEFISILVDQNDEKSTLNASKTIHNYRWLQSLQEKSNNPLISIYNLSYKRYQNLYTDRKSQKFKQYKSINNTSVQEFERGLQLFMNSSINQIKLYIKYHNDKEAMIEILMPHGFKFILHLLDYNIERIQVKSNDSKFSKENYDDNEKKEIVSIFDRLEENCIFAYTYYRSLYDSPMSSLKMLLQWIKHFIKLFNDKCVKCEKHLYNGLPPLWRDLKTYEIYHDECRL